MTDHTPGPWRAEIEPHKAPSDWYAAAIGVGSAYAGTYRTLARVPDPEHPYDEQEVAQTEANARLMATAPELLAAARATVAVLDTLAGDIRILALLADDIRSVIRTATEG